jgi:hypothetical protein
MKDERSGRRHQEQQEQQQEQEPRGESLVGKAGKASASMLSSMARSVLNTKGRRRPRIVAHTGGIPPIARIGNFGGRGGIRQSMNLEQLKPKNLRGQDISGRRQHK